MTESPARIYHLALRDLHTSAGAHFAVADGWSLPADYGDPDREYDAIRNHAAVFDRSARSRFLLSGTDALDVLRAVFAGYVDELEEGRAMRAVALDSSGRIRDLVLIARTGGISYMVSGEPGQRFETFARLQSAVQAAYDVRIDDRTETTVLLGIAGPAAGDLAREHLSEGLAQRIQLMHCAMFEFHGFRTLALRTSDLGEDGFEFMVAPAVAQHIIETLVPAGAPLAGETARTIARVESCVPAFAPDLETGVTPAQADLDALLGIPGGAEGTILAALLFDGDAIPQPGTPVLADGQIVGEVRSAVRSSSLRATIGLALIATGHALPGTALDASGQSALVAGKPFYRRRSTP